MDSSRLEQVVLASIEERVDRWLDVLADLVSVDTVSAERSSAEMRRGAELVASYLREIGFHAEVRSFGGHPLVVAEAGRGPIEVLFYNHYDVQPPDPLDRWETPPFKLVRRGELIYGRGVADNKGSLVARMAAVEALYTYLDELGLRLKFLVEGEEEIGSPTLPRAVSELRGWVRSHGGFWETAYVGRNGRLWIPLGFKGMVYVEIVVRTASRDVHSGYAPLVPNPVWRLASLLSSMVSPDGRVLVDWLYEGMEGWGREDLELLREIDPSELEELRRELGLSGFNEGVTGFEALKRLYLMPSVNVSGLVAGYTGPGSKTVVPSEARVKMDIRLVPGQDPARILQRLREFLASHGLGDAEVIVHGTPYPAARTRPGEPIVRASAAAAEKVYGRRPVLLPMAAGSGPYYVVAATGTPLTGAGVGYYGSRVHAPNEHIRFGDFVRGAKHVALTLIEFAQGMRSAHGF